MSTLYSKSLESLEGRLSRKAWVVSLSFFSLSESWAAYYVPKVSSSIKEILVMFKCFELCVGLKINTDKTKANYIGFLKGRMEVNPQARLDRGKYSLPGYSFKWK